MLNRGQSPVLGGKQSPERFPKRCFAAQKCMRDAFQIHEVCADEAPLVRARNEKATIGWVGGCRTLACFSQSHACSQAREKKTAKIKYKKKGTLREPTLRTPLESTAVETRRELRENQYQYSNAVLYLASCTASARR